jgi:drug/metabolite transporter (DMT)-like permease
MTHRTALLSLHAAVLLFGLSGLIGKSVSSPAVVVTCLRSLIGAVALGVFLCILSRGNELLVGTRGRVTAMLIGGALLAVHWWTFFMAIQWGTVALGLLTYASYPLFVTCLNWLLQRESVRRKDWWAAGAVLIGLGLVVSDWSFGSQAGWASLLGLTSGLTFAMLTLLNLHLTTHVPPLSLVTVQMATAGLILLPLAAPLIPQVTAGDWLWLSLLGVVFTGFAHASFTSSLKSVRVTAVSVAAALEPVYGMLAAWLVLGESPTMTMLIGATLIIGASFLSLLPDPPVENMTP